MAMLPRGARDHYLDPAYYDHRYGRRRDDVAHYVGLAVEYGDPVLELGVGTARVALATARAGFEVVGIDAVPEMLRGANERVARAPAGVAERITLQAGDVRTLRLGRRFPLITAPFNVFMHLYTRDDFAAAMETVRAHLTRGGHFAFDVLVPYPASLARDPTRLYRCGSVKPPGRPRLRYSESFGYDPVTQVQTVTMVYEPEEKRSAPVIRTLTQRQRFPEELLLALDATGFEIVSRWGSFTRAPFDAEADSQVLVVRSRRRR